MSALVRHCPLLKPQPSPSSADPLWDAQGLAKGLASLYWGSEFKLDSLLVLL